MKRIQFFIIITIVASCTIERNTTGYNPAAYKNVARLTPLDTLPLFDFEDSVHSYSEFKGRDILVFCWMVECMPCRDDVPMLYKKIKVHRPEMPFIALSFDIFNKMNAAKSFLSDNENIFILK
ncbi:MAG: TlpA family protein disulfide reductase [Cytophagaceae bacterium]